MPRKFESHKLFFLLKTKSYRKAKGHTFKETELVSVEFRGPVEYRGGRRGKRKRENTSEIRIKEKVF